MRKQHYLWIVPDDFLDINQISGHFWANSTAGSKEKIGNINFSFIIFLGDGFPVLIGKRKIGYSVVFTYILNGAIH
ncbi:hypothetical protein D3C84_1238360 [compost metagenome]